MRAGRRGEVRQKKYEVKSLSNRPHNEDDKGDNVETRLKFYSMVILDA
jgi:hypothetical protein